MVPEWIAAVGVFVASLTVWIPAILVLIVAVVALGRIAVCRDTRAALRPFAE